MGNDTQRWTKSNAWWLATAALLAAPCAGQPNAIQPAPTSVALFVGAAPGEGAGQPVRVTGWRQFQKAFGEPAAEGELGRAVRLYFLNGGREAWVARVEAGRAGPAEGAVVSSLEQVEGYDLLCLPGVADRGALRAAVKHCEKRRAILLLDLPAECDTAKQAEAWLAAHEEFRQPNVAAYLPWVQPTDAGRRPRSIPASGAIAGIIARTDRERGVWKAPAGPDAELRGVGALARSLSAAKSEALTELGVNPLRALPDGRVVAWGARTLATAPEWRYLPIRRLFLFLEESLSEGTEWAVFEPNDEPLWQKLRSSVGAFMQDLYRQGAFQGTTPGEAYFVKCGSDTTSQSDIQQGLCTIVVGFAPLKPAEFVIIRIEQKTAEAE